MKRALVIALAFLCAAPAAYGWHCSALNRDYAFPYDSGGMFPVGESDKVTMSSKEAVVSLGSGLEWVTNVALFAHNRNPVNYSKLVNHSLNTNLLPKAYMDWMYDQTRSIFTKDWHATYSDGTGTNTIEILGLHYGNPWDVDPDEWWTQEPLNGDIRLCDIRHHFYSEAFDFPKQPGWGRLVTAYSNSFERILGYPPSLYENNGNNYLPFDDIIGYYSFANLWNILLPTPGYPPNLQYLVSESFPTAFVTPVFTDLCLSYKFGGVSPFSVESSTSRKTNRTTYEVTITTNADYTATMKVKFIRHETPEHTNFTHTVERLAFGDTASAESTAYGEPGKIDVSSMYKIFLYGQPIYHTFDILGVATPCVCYGVGGAWAENQQFTNSVTYKFDYTIGRILADYPFMRSTYPPYKRGNEDGVNAAVVYNAVADGHSYDYGYTYADESVASGSGTPTLSSSPNDDAMRVVCDAAMSAANEFSSVTYDMWDYLHNNLPNVEYDEDVEDITIHPQIILHDGKTAFLMFREADNELMGVCNTNNWEWSPEYPNPYRKSFDYQPYYHESNYMQLYDVFYSGGEEWRMTLDLDFDAYGYWQFNNWHR